MGKTVAIVGQIASGKTTLAKHMEKNGFQRIVTYTTRPLREGEIDGVDYHFVKHKKFVEMVKAGLFAEHMDYIAKFGYVRYGTIGTGKDSLEAVEGVNKVVVLNPEGVKHFKEDGYDIFVVYLDMPQEVLMRRALQRGDNPSEIGRRIADDTRIFRDIESRGLIDLRITNPMLLPNQISDMIQSAL